jgi:hypothetical protein
MYVLQITYPMLVASSVANSQALHSHRQDAWNERHQQDDAMQLPAKEERSLSLGEVFRFEVNATGGRRARPTGCHKPKVIATQGNNPQKVWYWGYLTKTLSSRLWQRLGPLMNEPLLKYQQEIYRNSGNPGPRLALVTSGVLYFRVRCANFQVSTHQNGTQFLWNSLRI